MSELLKPIDAAQLAGVSYPTLKQWIYKGKIRTTKTAGGHHRIARSEIERVTGTQAAKVTRKGKASRSRLDQWSQQAAGNDNRSSLRGITGAGNHRCGWLRDHFDHYQR